MTLDIAMGGSTNTVLHLLAVAHEAGADFKMDDIDMLSPQDPLLMQGGSQYPKSIMYKTLTVPVASLPSWMSLPRADWSIRMSTVWME